MTLFTLGIPLSTVIGGPVSGALLGMSGIAGLAGWQWMFLLEGLPAVAIGVIVLFYLPDHPGDARFLSSRQRAWLETALAGDANRPVASHLTSTLKSFYDPRVIALCLIYLANTSANFSLAFFLPQIIATMGTSRCRPDCSPPFRDVRHCRPVRDRLAVRSPAGLFARCCWSRC